MGHKQRRDVQTEKGYLCEAHARHTEAQYRYSEQDEDAPVGLFLQKKNDPNNQSTEKEEQ